MSKSISKKIISWYCKYQRNLPWRNYKNLNDKQYKVLVSEFMLQQTQVNTVIPFFNAFYKKYKNIQSLSKTSNTRILKSWQGLGFYRRAKNLHATSKIICQKHKGKIPSNYNELIELPGVGDYTAKAILAIAFDKSFLGIDGNIKRLVSRIFLLNSSKNFLNKLKTKVETLIINKNNSELMQGLMELGALICKPNNPLCRKCPISSECLTYKRGKLNEKKNFKKIKNKNYFVIISKKKNKYLMTYKHELGPLKEFINFPIFVKKYSIKNSIKKLKFNNLKYIKKIKIPISNQNCNLFLYSASTTNKKPIKDYMYINKNQLEKKFQSSFMKKIMEEIK